MLHELGSSSILAPSAVAKLLQLQLVCMRRCLLGQLPVHSQRQPRRACSHADSLVAEELCICVPLRRPWCKSALRFTVGAAQFPDPVIKIAIEPKTKSDQQKMTDGLLKLAQEDPSFHFSRDDETNQTVIEGMGELHLVRAAQHPCRHGHAAPPASRHWQVLWWGCKRRDA